METIEQRYEKRAKLTEELARQFNNEAIKAGSIVRLDINERITGGSFQIKYELNNDPFIDVELHEKGNAIVYPSDYARDRIVAIAKELGHEVSWNNTATIGWLSF
jgi:hypothetical protein